MKNNVNNWNAFSRGLCVALLVIAAFCGICGLGAALNQIPWLLIAGGVCLLLLICAAIWFLGYKSHQPKEESTPRQVAHVAIVPVPANFKNFDMFSDEDDGEDEEVASAASEEEE